MKTKEDTTRSIFQPVDLTPAASGYLDVIRSRLPWQ
jgi:hypothetical protein